MGALSLDFKTSFDGSSLSKGLDKAKKDVTEVGKHEKKQSINIASAIKKQARQIASAKRKAYKDSGKAFYGYRTRVLRGIVRMKRGFKELKKQADKTWLGKKMWSGGGAAVAGMAAVAGAAQVGQKMLSSAKMGADIQRNAKAVGITAEQMQEWDYIFSRAGLETQDVSDAFATLADRAEDATAGATSMVEDFALVGVSVDDLKGKNPEQLFALFADGVANASDQNKALAAVVRTLGDDLGRKLLPMLKEGSGAFAAIKREAHELGIIMSNDTVEGLNKAEDSLIKLKKRWDSDWGTATAVAADAFTFGDEGAEELEDSAGDIFAAIIASSVDANLSWKEALVIAGQRQKLANEEEATIKKNSALKKQKEKEREEERVKQKAHAVWEEQHAKKQEAYAKRKQAAEEALEKREFQRLDPAEQKGVIEKRLQAAKAEEAAAEKGNRLKKGAEAIGLGSLFGDDAATTEAKLKRMELEDQLKGMSPSAALNVGQDHLARIGLFRGAQTEGAVVANRQLERLKTIDENTVKVARGMEALVNP